MIDVTDLDLNITDIPSQHMQMVADQCGISVAISLMKHVPGLELYIPASGKKAMDRNYIRKTFNGENTSSIAVHLGIDHKKVKKIIRKVQLENMDEPVVKTEQMMIVARECGEDIATILMTEFANHTLYIPKNGFSIAIRKYIERNHTGFNTANIAIKCNVTERHVRQVTSDLHASKSQLSLDLGL